jgi:alpha-L-fucosidase
MSPLRFTQTSDSFCIISLERPSANYIRITQPLPLAPSDIIRLLGGSGQPLNWSTDAPNGVVIYVSDEELSLVQYAWVFKIYYQA